MTRIQVLPLPPTHADPAPFALIVSGTDAKWSDDLGQRLRDRLGARAVLVFQEQVEVIP